MTSALSALLSGFALSASLIMAIGAQNAFVLRQGLKREHVGPVVLFCAMADAALICAGVAGLGALLAAMPRLTTLVALGGAAFLFGYGVMSFRRAARPEAMTLSNQPALPLGRALAAVAGFTFLNPHVYLDTVLLVGAAGAAQPAPVRPLFVAGAIAASFLWFAALGYGARLLAPVFTRPAAWRVLDTLIGALMFALALSLVVLAIRQG